MSLLGRGNKHASGLILKRELRIVLPVSEPATTSSQSYGDSYEQMYQRSLDQSR